MSAIKAVIFDLGRVLVQVDFTRGLMRRFAANGNLTDEQILEYVFREPLFKDFSRGEIDTNKFYQMLRSLYNLEISFADFCLIWCDIFAPMEGMESLVEQVAKNHKTGLLSDIDPLHWSYLTENYSFLSRFANPVLSFNIGALKPSPKCYRAAADSVGESAKNCLFIDDRRINVLGARKFGMQTIHFKNPFLLKKELQRIHVLS